MINAYTIMMAFVVASAFFLKGYKQYSKFYVIISSVAMFVVLGFRNCYRIGNDSSSSYLHRFQDMAGRDWQDVLATPFNDNPVFRWLMKAISDISSGDYQIFIIVISAFVMVCIAHFVYRYSVNPLQSFIYYWGLLLYSFMFNALKQSIAMSLVLLAFDAIVDKKLIRFIILVIFAALFHFPALVFLPAYFIAKMKIDKNYLILLVGLLLVTFIFRENILNFMTDIYDTDVNEEVTLRFLSNKALIMLAIVVAAILLRPPTIEDEIYCKLLSFMGIAIVFQTFCAYNNTFERLADYYFQFAIVFIPLVFEKIELKKSYFTPKFHNTVKTIVPIAFSVFGIWRFINSVMNDGSMFPYYFMDKI